MKTFLFCTCYISDHGEHTPERYSKYLAYYSSKMIELGVDFIFLIDDGSHSAVKLRSHVADILPAENLDAMYLNPGIYLVTFKNSLGRPTLDDHLGWWRSFVYSYNIASTGNFDKIIHIESDFYILSEKLMFFLRRLRTGWHTLWSRACDWPESGIQVICKDRFDDLYMVGQQARALGYNSYYPAENSLPFSSVHIDFSGDRVNCLSRKELGLLYANLPTLDYIGNISINTIPNEIELKI